jgi:hypothetical protein
VEIEKQEACSSCCSDSNCMVDRSQWSPGFSFGQGKGGEPRGYRSHPESFLPYILGHDLSGFRPPPARRVWHRLVGSGWQQEQVPCFPPVLESTGKRSCAGFITSSGTEILPGSCLAFFCSPCVVDNSCSRLRIRRDHSIRGENKK